MTERAPNVSPADAKGLCMHSAVAGAGSGQRKSFASGNYGFIRLIVYTLCHHQNTNKIYTAFTNRFRHALHSIQELFKTITDLLHNSSDAKKMLRCSGSKMSAREHGCKQAAQCVDCSVENNPVSWLSVHTSAPRAVFSRWVTAEL